MYNLEKRKGFNHITIGRLISELETLPQDSEVTICGDSYCFIHVENDESIVTLDNEDLDDSYEEFPNFDHSSDFSDSSNPDELSRKRLLEIINNMIETLSNYSNEEKEVIINEFINSGVFSEEEVIKLGVVNNESGK